MHCGFTTNEYGTRISVHVCESCGEIFTVCPAIGLDQDDGWRGCMAPGCSSYDQERDVDRLFQDGDPVADGRIRMVPEE